MDEDGIVDPARVFRIELAVEAMEPSVSVGEKLAIGELGDSGALEGILIVHGDLHVVTAESETTPSMHPPGCGFTEGGASGKLPSRSRGLLLCREQLLDVSLHLRERLRVEADLTQTRNQVDSCPPSPRFLDSVVAATTGAKSDRS
jgi:hypothetical protein